MARLENALADWIRPSQCGCYGDFLLGAVEGETTRPCSTNFVGAVSARRTLGKYGLVRVPSIGMFAKGNDDVVRGNDDGVTGSTDDVTGRDDGVMGNDVDVTGNDVA